MNEPVRTRRTSEIGPVDYGEAGRSWHSRVSWAAVLAGLAVSMGVMLLINQIMVWANFGLGSVTTPGSLSLHMTAIGLWLSLSAFIGIFAGSYVAAVAAGSRQGTNGLWHGLSVWGSSVVLALILSTVGIAPLLGFGITPHSIVSYFGLTGSAGASITVITGNFSGWFLLEVFVGLIAGVAGGTMGANRRAARRETVATPEEYQERRAA